MKNEKGFSLIELVLVMVVTGILAVSAISAYFGVEDNRVDGAAKRLASDLAYARQMALTENGVFGIAFDTVNDTYAVHEFDPATAVETTIANTLTQTAAATDFDGIPGMEGVTIQVANFGGTQTVRFSSNGTPQDDNEADLAAQGTVVLNHSGVTRTITVQANTGEINIQ